MNIVSSSKLSFEQWKIRNINASRIFLETNEKINEFDCKKLATPNLKLATINDLSFFLFFFLMLFNKYIGEDKFKNNFYRNKILHLYNFGLSNLPLR